jgi:nitrate/nitrite transport system substrate-binding protein
MGSVYASDAPETSNEVWHHRDRLLKYCDCAREGPLQVRVNSVVSKGASWAAIRDALSTAISGTHMLLECLSPAMGLAGSPKPMIVPGLSTGTAGHLIKQV